MSPDPVVIAAYVRTPLGAFEGALAGASATELGAVAIKEVVARARVDPQTIERLYMGCVLGAGLGQAPARQAGMGAGLPVSVEATTLNKVCGSGMQAVIMAAEALGAGSVDMVVAGGMESMTNAPYLLAKHRRGMRMGHDVVKDSMLLDGLEDAYTAGKSMGAFAEDTAREYQLTREAQDAFAIRSLERALAAIASGAFAREVAPVSVAARGGNNVVETDEQPGRAKPAKIPTLKPAFAKDGTITAASSASISDGAAALVVTRASVAEKFGLPMIARIVAHAAHAQEPALFTTAPVQAISKLLSRAGWSVEDVDLFEINEAFAIVPMIAALELGIPGEKLNVNGGATALGHPLGASGARVLATLLGALENRGLRRGVASLCIGGGEATALALDLI